MKKIIIILTIVICLFGCDKARTNARFGNTDYKKKDYKQAQEYYKKSLKEDSTFKPVQYNLANTYMQDKTQDYNQAIEYYNKYLQQLPNTKKSKKSHTKGLYNRGNAYFNLSQQNKQDSMYSKYLTQAANDYKQVMMLDPKDEDAKYNYALCLWLMKNNNSSDNNDNQNNSNSSNSEINQMLEAMKNNEKNTISKVKKQEEKVKRQDNEKDW